MSAAPGHVPVLLDEAIAAIAPSPDMLSGMVVVDATFGGGGYSRRLLDAGATVHAFDRDPDAVRAVRDNAGAWPETGEAPPRLILHPRRFSEMVEALAADGIAQVDGVVMDIGVSSMQLDRADRGFAFSLDGPLDMRMGQDGPTAADFVNTASEQAIADVLFHLGEERQSRRVARAIVAARTERGAIATTGELAAVVRRATGFRQGRHGPGAPKDPATRSFQAIRIHVNAELDELTQGLAAAERLLREGGRLAAVSFHSLEDRIVKQFLRDAAQGTAPASRHLPSAASGPAPTFAAVSRAVRPSAAEVARNPRARSATLRWATRTGAPPRDRPDTRGYATQRIPTERTAA